MKNRILFKAIELFTIYGFRAIPMERIARELGCSTKTLYQHYPNKTILIKKMVEQGIERDKQFIEKLEEKNSSSISKLLEFKGYIYTRHVQNLYPGMTDDLIKYEPDIYLLIDTFFQEVLEKWFIKMLENGKIEGDFRDNINPDILAKYLIELSMKSLSTQIFPPSKIISGLAYTELIKNFMYGISSLNGVRFLNENFNKYLNIK
ncbi:TetR/AcrR family transcriptional regulator [Mangrovivirga sp. M17]|uniref:TetR/AcrR family transcriptional regulator n=1 Tax=Mangrovivirga halotolerans TaxID=2993936 RepID=A0ABT3RRB7_9BACT|nr:TetR/AcrR family transcriptional regulator [Mangrovivirga halotolerans]MCX2743812.1 TetR/AcrR family transcriptional regulator [Mangrovivirga halotolerans]